MKRIQAIDIGTNSVRSIVVEVPVGGPYRIIDDEREMSRLGRGLDATGTLDDEAVSATTTALRAMMEIGRSLEVEEVRAIATEAVRRASNGAEFIATLERDIGLSVEIISADEEGRLVWLSAAPQTKGAEFSAVVDIGGGSVEVVQAVESELSSIVSLRLGARVLAERFVTEDPISDDSFKALKRFVRKSLRDAVRPIAPGATRLIGSGGTVTSIAALVAGMRGRRYESVHGVEIARAEVMRLLGSLSHANTAERLSMPGMAADRADIILPGALVLAEIMRLLGVSGVLVNARGIREGIVIDTLASEGALDPLADPSSAVRDLGQRFRYDRAHADQVTALSLSLFDQLAEKLGLDTSKRGLLEAASLLHDVGYFISYDRHHRHSYHLILHSSMPGYTQRELAVIAATARYHTKALPKRSHDSWASLDPRDRATVRGLAAILRIADGLDRGRAGRVSGVSASDDGETVYLSVSGKGDLGAELYGVEKKKDLFEDAFGRKVQVTAEQTG